MEDYDVVLNARGEGRLTASDYITRLMPDFMEFHGDRLYGDDSAVVAGIGSLMNMPVTVIGIEKGKTTEERIRHNFGSAHPEGYRKALRLMKQAEKFHRPVLCLVDTAGAFCGIDAENLLEMADLKMPVLSVVLGEGGSGGALALSHSDRIWMMEDAYFSVVSPESCANILWKTTEKAREAAEVLCLTAAKLNNLGLIDRVCAADDIKKLGQDIRTELESLLRMPVNDLLEQRYRKFRSVGY